jgi:putative ABC transport system substrate-binding protein
VRQFKLSICILLGLWCLLPCQNTVAEQRLIAVVMTKSPSRFQEVHSAFVKDASAFCSESCKLYVQTPNADMMSLRNAVRKAVALGADMIVTYGTLPTLAAQAEVPPIPTLFADVYDPVGLGIVSSKTMTGRRISGVRGDGPIQGLMKYFRDTVKLKKLGVIYDTRSPVALLQKQILEKSGKRKGIEVVALAVDEQAGYLETLQALPGDVGGVFMAGSEHQKAQIDFVLEHTSTNKIPVITQCAKTAELGAFMVLETSAIEQGVKLAEMAAQVFSGTDVENVPMQKPHEVAFVVNLNVAKQYGITIPIQTLSVASRIIR